MPMALRRVFDPQKANPSLKISSGVTAWSCACFLKDAGRALAMVRGIRGLRSFYYEKHYPELIVIPICGRSHVTPDSLASEEKDGGFIYNSPRWRAHVRD